MPSVFLSHALLSDGWASNVRLDFAGGMIASVEAGAEPAGECHAIGVPGLPNLHSHGFQRGMAGLSEVRGPATDSFWTWREVMYRFLAALTPDDVEAITAQAYVEMLESGFTRVGEFHYLHNDAGGGRYADPAEMAVRIAAAAATTGIGLTLLPSFYAHGGFGRLAPTQGQRRFVMGLDAFGTLLDGSARAIAPLPGAALGIAPHSLRAVAADELAALLAMAPSGPVHMHIAEQEKEVAGCVAWSGARPVAWLLDHAPVDERWCLVHATHMDAAETTALALTGATVSLCPVTEANLGDGIFPGEAWLATGGRYGIGTDSNIAASAASELRQLEYAQRLARRGRNLMAPEAGSSTGRALFDHAVASSAALGIVGGLREGTPADLVTLRAEHPALLSRTGDAWLDGWIFAARESAVDAVWAAGRLLVTGGRHAAREEVGRRYAEVLDRLLAA